MAPSLNDYKDHLEQIKNLSSLDFNYDAETYRETADKSGWHIDKHRASLGIEPRGEPVPGGIFERAKAAVGAYKFPDPKLITGYFDPSAPLEGRNMLLHGKFMGLSFYFGVRVVDVIDSLQKNEAGHDAQVWGYSYRTLHGHFEVGQIYFRISKDIESGEVNFEIDSYSRTDRIPNFFYRVGFRIFGRPLQIYFAKSSIARLREIVRDAPGTVSQAVAT